MKCPKCHYIGFDSGERCRNCGYEFSLSVQSFDPDLPIQTGLEPVGPLADLSLRDPEAGGPAVLDPEPALAAPAIVDIRSAARTPPERGRAEPSGELPLFKGERALAIDRPVVAPRPPLAVRRGAAGPPRRARPASADEGRLNLEPAVENDAPAPVPSRTPVALLLGQREPVEADPDLRPAGPVERALAGTIDVLLLVAINAAVLYFTLKVCGLQLHEIALVPAIPFAGYLLLLDGGYSVAFTAAGGQTIGKMAAGIKVIPARLGGADNDRVPIGQALLRSVAWVASAVAVGLGFLPVLFGAERRAVHDWLAATRVVKA